MNLGGCQFVLVLRKFLKVCLDGAYQSYKLPDGIMFVSKIRINGHGGSFKEAVKFIGFYKNFNIKFRKE